MIDWQLARFGIYKITDELFVGQYPKAESFDKLREIGILDILTGCGNSNKALRQSYKWLQRKDLCAVMTLAKRPCS